MILSGTPDEIDRKLGRFLYLSELFLSRELPFEFHCLSGGGLRVFSIANEREQNDAIGRVLELSLSAEAEMPPIQAAWHYHIGGEAYEE